MSTLFFYGTLRHLPLLEVVVGRPVTSLDLRAAILPDHAVLSVPDEDFPTIEKWHGRHATGLMARGLSDDDLARLRYYEGGFDYDLKPVQLRLPDGSFCPARVFFPAPGSWQSGAPWSLERWQADWGALAVRAAMESMSYMGRFSADELAARATPIRMRAAGWLTARSRPADPDRDIESDVLVHHHHRPYANFFAVEEMDLQFRRYDGKMSPVLNRGALMMGEAAVVLPYDPKRDKVLLVEQFRAPVFMGGSRAPWVWEPIAGLTDPGETPEGTAHREVMEEAGLTLSGLEKVCAVYSSTGSSSDYVHVFIGLTDLTGDAAVGGLASEGEDIRSLVIDYETMMARVDAQEYQDMPLYLAALWLARHRDRLRSMA